MPSLLPLTRSSDDSKCNYSSLHHGDDKEDLVEEDIKDSVRLQKMFRRLQRQIHSPDHQVCRLGPGEV